MPVLSPALTTTNDPFAAALARWRATVDAELKGASFEKKLVTRTFEGIALQPLYTRADVADVPALETRPGTAPFLRGVRPLGYLSKSWEVAQEIAAAESAVFNSALCHDLMGGQNAVMLTPDIASRSGHDPDEASPYQVGVGGVSIADGEDFATALRSVDLAAVPVHLEAGADALPLAALYFEYARTQGTVWTKLTGTLSADPLSEWIARGALPDALETLYGSLAGWTNWAEIHAPHVSTIGINAIHWGDAGATATQELAFALAAAAEYLRALDKRGVTPTTAAARMNFRFAIGAQFFMEAAKFRAFRPLWARVVSAFGAAPEIAGRASVHAATGRWDKTLLDPHVNMLRATTEALSAVLGGCDSLHISPFDEVTGATTEFSRRIARNVHTLLAEEFNFANTADPAGGSWYIEKLTDTLARNAWTLFQDIESRGGMAAALRVGYPQQLVAKAVAEKNGAAAKRRLGIVGTNLFPNLKEKPLTPAVNDFAARQAKLAWHIRTRRGIAPPVPAATNWPARFTSALAAAGQGATVGQLSRMVREEAVPEPSIERVVPRRASEQIEGLRAASAAFAETMGFRPRVFLAKIGPTIQHKARADFAAGFFAVGGFEVLGKQGFDTAETAAAAAVASGARVVVLCSTDETYPALVPVFAGAVKVMKGDQVVVLAGLPADAATVNAYREAGVDEFIHLRANVCELLAKFLKQIGAPV